MAIYSNMKRANTALLIIDPVNSCVHENCETPERNIRFTKIRATLPKLAEFVNEYRQRIGGMIIFTTLTPWNEKHLPPNLNELYTDPRANYYSEDTVGFDEQFHTVIPQKGDLVIAKNTYDAFTNNELLSALKKKGIQYIVVTGVFTDGCVLASVVSGFSKGFNFVILKDLVETTDVDTRQELQKSLIDYTFPVMYGKTISSGEFLDVFSP
ncbi:MAG: hypothetical protein A2418_03500 [Candidatus Brennerbacteria bacterium RIFOXYC1_FULL_41_11]|uniref:Isochorismatase-like domain-containing protein n=1 Tax=Candidatus Brennerbacteria bacterium RIFOXYD1_FULL_41_16 TaxID=1797529 RepID=A0A1G1XKK4_9BACT|nr:MAG: hypothetical protein A2391_00560 [Candidatus Brennerbacteria bacterium RIFOXYB1_FULL_41_13]OGY38908.1 MAG: hypothetical protein A2418_03500 [Candidatus Brennerbacteria bacterium RIFOXYC1_FULL_41_11]OGY40538.1 MAG: hypothetical protein A2570_02245 [Candidatus Brennerbacteria bacterium RIFOXYD1_FULL_41_16]